MILKFIMALECVYKIPCLCILLLECVRDGMIYHIFFSQHFCHQMKNENFWEYISSFFFSSEEGERELLLHSPGVSNVG